METKSAEKQQTKFKFNITAKQKIQLDDLIQKIIDCNPAVSKKHVNVYTGDAYRYLLAELEKHKDNMNCMRMLIEIKFVTHTDSLAEFHKYEHTGHPAILNALGVSYTNLEVYDDPNMHKIGLNYLDVATSMGYLPSMTNRGVCHMMPEYGDIDLDKALELFEHCVENSYYRPLLFIADICSGDKTSKYYNKEKAIDALTIMYYVASKQDYHYSPDYTSNPFDILCSLQDITEPFQKVMYRAILENGKMQYFMKSNIESKLTDVSKQLLTISDRVTKLETELYAPGNLGYRVAKKQFTTAVAEIQGLDIA